MSVQDLNAALDMIEANEKSRSRAFTFFVKNANGGAKTDFYAAGDNWLIQVMEGTAQALGIDPNEAIYYSNDEGKTTSDGNITLAEFGIKENSVLTLHPSGVVAANI